MEAETDTEVEYERLREGLVWEDINGFASSIHAAQTHVDGTAKLTHLYVVSDLAGRYAARFFEETGAEPFEQKYLAIVCRAAGLLHEAMAAGKDYEEIVEVSDEAVAGVIASLTPDRRLPRPRRLQVQANAWGLATEAGQLVALADLQHTAAGLQKVLEGKDPPRELVRRTAEEGRILLASLAKLTGSFVFAGPLTATAGAFKVLEQKCRARKD